MKNTTLITLALLIAAVFAMTGAGYWWGLHAAAHAAIADMDEGAVTSTAIVEGRIARLRHVSDVVAASRCAIELLRAPSDSKLIGYMNEYLARVAEDIGAEDIYMMSSDGTVIAASNYRDAQSFLGKNYGFRPYFRDAIAGQHSHEIAIGATSNTLGYYLAHPVHVDGEIRGVVTTKVALLPLEQDWRQKIPDPQLIEFVTDGNGVIIMDRPAQDTFRYHTLRPLTEQARAELQRDRSYAAQALPPLAIHHSDSYIDGVELVDLPGLPDSRYYTKRYPMAELGELNIYAERDYYAQTTWVYTALAFMASLSLAVVTGILWQRAYYRRQLYEAALNDPLTGLYTRFYLQRALPELFGLHDRHSVRGLALLMIDIDHFKQINDRYGHLAGDCVLHELGTILLATARKGDLAGRYGGEEFVIFSPIDTPADAHTLAERVREAVQKRQFPCHGHNIEVTVSIGVAIRQENEQMEHVIDRADQLLYAAKNAGRNCVRH